MKKITFLLIILITLIILYLANPTENEFKEHIYNEYNNTNIKYEEVKTLGLDKWFEALYQKKDYVIFTIYKTNDNFDKNGNYIYIGILKNFIKFNA